VGTKAHVHPATVKALRLRHNNATANLSMTTVMPTTSVSPLPCRLLVVFNFPMVSSFQLDLPCPVLFLISLLRLELDDLVN